MLRIRYRRFGSHFFIRNWIKTRILLNGTCRESLGY